MSSLAQRVVTPRAVFCVIDHLYRDLAVADAVRAGRFTHAGVTLDLGPEPNWLATDLPADPEWRIEWSKFYYGLDLAHAYATTADQSYLTAWVRLVSSWITQVPPGADRTDVTARRVLNWIYAWQRFASADAAAAISPSVAELMLESIGRQLRHVRKNLTIERNHRTFELYALFVATLALPELRLEDDTLDFAIHELTRNLLEDVRTDGVHREASTHYHHVALRSYLGVYENARRFSLILPDAYRARLERACEFALHCHRPDGAIPALSDSDTGTYLELLDLAGTLLARPDFRYVATAGVVGDPPTQLHANFAEGGYYTQRSDWSRDARYLIFDCGPLGDGGHGHYDLLNVEIAAHGGPLIVDPGRYTYAEGEPNWRHWFKSTAAHNTVTVDGLDQTPYRRGAPRGVVAQGRLLWRLTVPDLDVLLAEARSPSYEVVHRRRILFVADDYWLIEDQLHGTHAHDYDLRFHLTPDAAASTQLRHDRDQTVVEAPRVALVIQGGATATLQQGWYAPTYGVKHPAPVVSVCANGAAIARFITLIVPRRTLPALRVQSDGTTTVAEIRHSGVHDEVSWTAHAARFRRIAG